MGGHPLFFCQPLPGTPFAIGAQKEIRHIPVAEQQGRVRVERLLQLNPIISVIEDGVVGEDESVRLDRYFGLAKTHGIRGMTNIERGFPDDVAGLTHRRDGRLAGIFARTQPSGRRQFEYVVGVEELGLRCRRPVGRHIVELRRAVH